MPENAKSKKEDSTPLSTAGTIESPLIFISHDSRDGDLAEAFANLLQDASGGILKSFRSSDKKGTTGIEFGAEWYRTIMDKLDNATDVVALLTTQSLNRPWILYETGVAKGKLDATVFGLALGIPLSKVSTGPFAQFQNSDDDIDSITKLVLQLIRRHPQAAPREEAVKRQVEAFLEDIKVLLNGRTTGNGTEVDIQQVGDPDESPVAKLFEEVKVLVGGMPKRVAEEIQPSQRKNKRLRRLQPGMIRRLSKLIPDDDGMTSLLIMLSLVREEFPWLYDIGLELYRAEIRGDQNGIESTRHQLHHAMEMMLHGPGELFIDSRDAEEALMFLRSWMEDYDEFSLSLRNRNSHRPKGESSRE